MTWFVAVHNRDSAYFRGDDRHSYRNCSIHNFFLASEHIRKSGGTPVRIGEIFEESTPSWLLSPSELGSKTNDTLDVYITENCRFFLGCSSGPWTMAAIFNRPVIYTNMIPYRYGPLREGDIFLPKKVWNKEEKRYLTFKEVLEFEDKIMYKEDIRNRVMARHNRTITSPMSTTDDYKKEGLEPHENTPEEILLAVKDMMNPKKTNLQDKFMSMYEDKHPIKNTPARPSPSFLEENKELI